MSEQTVKALNQFLKGRYMGIDQYEHYIAHTKDSRLKAELGKLQEETRRQAESVARRIQELGGEPADGTGPIGKLQEAFKNLKGYPEQPVDILHDLLTAEKKYALDRSHEIVEGELDPQSAALVRHILDQDQEHARRLSRLLQERLPAGAAPV
ncbi:ferritin-like domain-containing protein [Gorillibacterium sp. sgz5001074]|uniref:ferritin-like domain-containing protein n=1 Tax=Gorillibacterium sp. sgz5001074 TaxID=3446695 RepID=UPI003F67F994